MDEIPTKTKTAAAFVHRLDENGAVGATASENLYRPPEAAEDGERGAPSRPIVRGIRRADRASPDAEVIEGGILPAIERTGRVVVHPRGGLVDISAGRDATAAHPTDAIKRSVLLNAGMTAGAGKKGGEPLPGREAVEDSRRTVGIATGIKALRQAHEGGAAIGGCRAARPG